MKALVVDDNPLVLDMLTKSLKEEHFSVDRSVDGEDAFHKARFGNFEIILLDIMLPKKSGFEIVSALRALGIATPVILISGRSFTSDKVKGLDLGADDYLVKGFSMSELIARVKSLIRRNNKHSNNIIRCGDLMVDFSKMTVERRGRLVMLTRKEFGLLVQMIKKQNSIVSREELIANVWETGEQNVSSNTVDVHIQYLRKKIEKPFHNGEIIHTVRGVGYMIKSPRRRKKWFNPYWCS